jgi:NNP family nitrate/nitrite transporter-like MFS transporter
MLAIFLFAGIGNASTFKQMPMIFEKSSGWWRDRVDGRHRCLRTVLLRRRHVTTIGATAFYSVGIAWAVMCVAITWVRYARKGAPKPS